MNSEERRKVIEQAKEWRLPVALLLDAALPEKIVLSDSLINSWLRHVRLLGQVYPEPLAQDRIKVEILEYYPTFKLVLQTSFPDISSYARACDELGWPYKLDSEQIRTCHYCQMYYYDGDGEELEDEEGLPIGFCEITCLENYEIKLACDAESLEYMIECFPDQYERVDGKVRPKALSPELQKAFQEAWKRAIE